MTNTFSDTYPTAESIQGENRRALAARKPTRRQQMWLDAAKVEADHGNGVCAGLFLLIAQPSEKEV